MFNLFKKENDEFYSRHNDNQAEEEPNVSCDEVVIKRKIFNTGELYIDSYGWSIHYYTDKTYSTEINLGIDEDSIEEYIDAFKACFKKMQELKCQVQGNLLPEDEFFARLEMDLIVKITSTKAVLCWGNVEYMAEFIETESDLETVLKEYEKIKVEAPKLVKMVAEIED